MTNNDMVGRLADLLKQPLDDYSLEIISVAELYGGGRIKESDILELKKRYAKLMNALMEDE